MKVVALILSSYLAALSIVPCSDGLEQCKDNGEIQITLTNQDHDHSDHSNDTCTPFCSCACCGSFITFPLEKSMDEYKARLSTAYIFPLPFNYSFDFMEGVWHPPAIS